MRKKVFLVIGLMVAFLVVTACSPAPEKNLLSRYFNAMTLNDNQTMASMALQPIKVELDSWEILSVGPETITPARLADLNAKEMELKKEVEGNIGPTVEAKDLLDIAQEDMDTARTSGARAAAKRKVDELQAKYDAQYARHRELQQGYNDAKKAAADEEEMTKFSLGVRELATIRDLTGNVHTKQVDVAIKNKSGATTKYRLHLKQYALRDEVNNLRHNGRWVIIRFEPIA
ncbi:MAG: hypothetical protein R6X21_10050 [Candidatus Aminicenantes bacterium]